MPTEENKGVCKTLKTEENTLRGAWSSPTMDAVRRNNQSQQQLWGCNTPDGVAPPARTPEGSKACDPLFPGTPCR